MRDYRGAGVLKCLAAGDVVEVMVAVDQILDGLVSDLLYLVDILLPAGRSAVGDRIGGDHAIVGDDEHRLMVAIAEDVDVVGIVDLFGLDLWPLRLCRRRWLLRLRCRYGQGRDQRGRHSCEIYPRHGVYSLVFR